ncbi:MAG TPA: hypothetical protein VFO32_05645 [Sphingomicrobium sp.]|jgi:hypothetical protein|nr:hypothetical protein [Sphingomicrobium sp.]
MIPLTAPPQSTHTDAIHRQQCLDQAARCRRLAYSISDRQASDALLALAADYERNAWIGSQAAAAI